MNHFMFANNILLHLEQEKLDSATHFKHNLCTDVL